MAQDLEEGEIEEGELPEEETQPSVADNVRLPRLMLAAVVSCETSDVHTCSAVYLTMLPGLILQYDIVSHCDLAV